MLAITNSNETNRLRISANRDWFNEYSLLTRELPAQPYILNIKLIPFVMLKNIELCAGFNGKL